jgi:hypothetical protein
MIFRLGWFLKKLRRNYQKFEKLILGKIERNILGIRWP